MSTRRPTRFAGTWYPAEPERLARLLGQAQAAAAAKLTQEAASGSFAAALLPHAGLGYAAWGQMAGLAGAAAWRGREARVFLLAPSHYLALDPDTLYDASFEAYGTPLGELAAWCPDFGEHRPCAYDQALLREHALELLLPALAWTLPDARLCPLLVGPLSSLAAVERLAGRIARVLSATREAGQPCLVLASSDLTHYGRRFEHQPYGEPSSRECCERVAARDRAACSLLAAGDAEGLWQGLSALAPTMCGRHPALLLAALARRFGLAGQILAQYRSDQAEACEASAWPEGIATLPGPDGFVSYAAVRFGSPEERHGL